MTPVRTAAWHRPGRAKQIRRPLVCVFLSALAFLAETISGRVGLASLLVLGGVALVILDQQKI